MENQQLQDEFRQLCSDKYLQEMIDFIKKHKDSIDIDAGFMHACVYNEMQVAKYLLNHCNANMHAEQDYAIKWACINKHNELAKYLLTSQELQEHADVKTAFIACCNFGNKHLIEYLILHGDHKTISTMQCVIDKSPAQPTFEYAKKLINTLTLKNDLEKSLPLNNFQHKRIKI